jgi:magnesium-transporting ATPase (P-type)
MLPGLSAGRLAGFVRPFGIITTLIFIIILFAYQSANEPDTGQLLLVAVLLIAISILLQSVLVAVASARERQEAAAGYVTANRKRQELPQLHPVTGVVIREAGEEFLTELEYLELRKRR